MTFSRTETMKQSAIIFCVLLAVIAGAQFTSAQTAGQRVTETECTQNVNDGMFFNVLSVVDNVCYGTDTDGAWYLVYDDADAGMFYEAIRVTKETYYKVVDAIENRHELCGRLYAIQEYETTEYELRTED